MWVVYLWNLQYQFSFLLEESEAGRLFAKEESMPASRMRTAHLPTLRVLAGHHQWGMAVGPEVKKFEHVGGVGPVG